MTIYIHYMQARKTHHTILAATTVVEVVFAGREATVLTVGLPFTVCLRGPATQQYIRTHMETGITTQKRTKKKTERPIASPVAVTIRKRTQKSIKKRSRL